MYQMAIYTKKDPWNKNKLVGQKRPLTLQQIWEVRVRLELNKNPKELALFNLGIDSKLRGCDLVSLRVRDIAHGTSVQSRAMIIQQKTGKTVQFEITKKTRLAVAAHIKKNNLTHSDFLFQSRNANSIHLSTRQYSRMVTQWIESIGLDATHFISV